MRVGAVDIGTNTVRLLVVEVNADGLGKEIAHHAIVTRLGQGVDGAGMLHPEAVSRTLDVLARYGTIMDEHWVSHRRVIATSAARDAANAPGFLHQAAINLGQQPEIISGAEEAKLSFSGAGLGRHSSGPMLIIDLGGGSTEFVAGTDEPAYAHSVDIGSVRLTERHLGTAPAAASDIARARDHVAALFQEELELPQVTAVVGVAGTFTTLCAIHLELAQYSRAAVHGTVLTGAVLSGLVGRLAAMHVDEIAAIPSMHPGRAPVILAGAIIAEQALSISGREEVTISENDILQGVAMSILDE